MEEKTKENSSKALEYQLDVLKQEIEIIDNLNARYDEMTQSVKNWAILGWAAMLAYIIKDINSRVLIGWTAMVPLVFWYLDAYLRKIQMRSNYRKRQIRKFLNDGRLHKSFETGRLESFQVLDVTGATHKHEDGYKRVASTARTFLFREAVIAYAPLIVASIVLHLAVMNGIVKL